MIRSPLSLAVLRTKALAHPVRLRILVMLRGGGLCVCQMTAALGLAPSTVSAHLGDLRRADLVSETKSGKWVEYELRAGVEGDSMIEHLFRSLEADERIKTDSALVRKLRKVSLEKLCAADLDLEQLGLVLPSRSAAAPPARNRKTARTGQSMARRP